MNYVANRDHSELELRQKLNSFYDQACIDQAMTWAKMQSWFSSPDDLKLKLTEKLNHRGKSIDFINKELELKGLPFAVSSFDSELRKAKFLVLTKWNLNAFNGLPLAAAQKLKGKIVRFLISRGYDTEITQTILNNDYKAKDFSHDEQF